MIALTHSASARWRWSISEKYLPNLRSIISELSGAPGKSTWLGRETSAASKWNVSTICDFRRDREGGSYRPQRLCFSAHLIDFLNVVIQHLPVGDLLTGAVDAADVHTRLLFSRKALDGQSGINRQRGHSGRRIVSPRFQLCVLFGRTAILVHEEMKI